jgi:tetratricopeptide (TPR) repeat protein
MILLSLAKYLVPIKLFITMTKLNSLLALPLLLIFSPILLMAYPGEGVTATVIKLNLPTYALGPDEQNPLFQDFNLPGMTYFRSSRSVYPYTFQNKYTQTKKDSIYDVVRLENEYIIADIIPALRGRLQGAIDKRNGWDFIYYNHVIKPAEIAVRSAWISGGIEWTHPGGHGYSQFTRISYRIMDEPDGGKSIIVGEIEPNRRIKWESKITLRPGQLFLETTGRIMSIKPYSVPFANSDNAAMKATDEMELIYPPKTSIVWHNNDPKTYPWPDPDGTGANYAWFKETKRILSVFAMGNGLLEDWWGVYSHDKDIDAGTAIVSDHRKAPGKKYFTWGSHAQGRMWDTVLSDQDGPYVELQQQAFFNHLNYGYAKIDPMEIKEYTTYWIPVMNTGGFVKASRDLVLNLDTKNPGTLGFSLQANRKMDDCTVTISKNGTPFFTEKLSLDPKEPFTKKIKILYENSDLLYLSIIGPSGVELLNYSSQTGEIASSQYRIEKKESGVHTIDELFTLAKSNKYDPLGKNTEEALRKILEIDPKESRANRELAIIYYDRGLNEMAKKHLLTSLENDHMEDSYYTYFLLGMIDREEGNLPGASAFLKIASRKKEVKPLAMVELIYISYTEGKYREGLALAGELIQEGMRHPLVYTLISYGNRKLGQTQLAEQACQHALEIDPLSFSTWYERYLVSPGPERKAEINQLFDRRDSIFLGTQLYIETATEYMQWNDFEAAREILQMAAENFINSRYQHPLVFYYLGYCESRLGNYKLAENYFQKASVMSVKYAFPYRRTTELVLNQALELNPDDSNAWFMLGNLLFYHRRHREAVNAWHKSAENNPGNAIAFRNLANGIFFLEKDTLKAVQMLEKAAALESTDLRILQELDYSYEAYGEIHKRLALLEERKDQVKSSPDLALRMTDLYIRTNKYEKALDIISTSYFPATEGSVQKNPRHARYAEAHIGIGNWFSKERKYEEAILQYLKAMEYPGNLNEKEPEHPVYTRVFYLIAQVWESAGSKKQAAEYYKKAASTSTRADSEATYYKALAYQKLGDDKKAKETISQLEAGISSMGPQQEDLKAYLQSFLYDLQGENQKAEEVRKKAFKMNPKVDMDARVHGASLDPRI